MILGLDLWLTLQLPITILQEEAENGGSSSLDLSRILF